MHEPPFVSRHSFGSGRPVLASVLRGTLRIGMAADHRTWNLRWMQVSPAKAAFVGIVSPRGGLTSASTRHRCRSGRRRFAGPIASRGPQTQAGWACLATIDMHAHLSGHWLRGIYRLVDYADASRTGR